MEVARLRSLVPILPYAITALVLGAPTSAKAAACGPGSQDLIVQAGSNQVVVGGSTTLAGTVSGGAPNEDCVVTWTQLSGPGPAVFGDPQALDSSVQLPGFGTWVLRLRADAGAESATDEVAITVVAAPTDLRAFPGAEGFGARAVGGRGGSVFTVTTLADSGPGSLREAIDAEGPRTIVFQVGGIIWLETGLEIRNPYVTVAGHTAPGNAGITLANGSSTVTSLRILTHDVVLRHLRVRPGPGGDPDAISIEEGAAYNVIIDHCSLSWGVDETLSTYLDAHHVTVQWSIVSEALYCSTGVGCQSAGVLLGSAGGHSVSVHHNLFAHNFERNPRVQSEGVTDVVNNVIYNPGFSGGWGPSHVSSTNGATIRVNYVANLYEPGADSGTAEWLVSAEGSHQIYLEGNQVPVHVIDPSDLDQVVALPHATEAVTATSAALAREEVLAAAGAHQALVCNGALFPRRDAVDERIVSDVIQGSGTRIDDPSEVGGYPSSTLGTPCADTDMDGAPDAWEARVGLDPEDPDDAAADPDGDGYTALEDYLTGSLSPPAVPASSVSWDGVLAFLLAGAGLFAVRLRSA